MSDSLSVYPIGAEVPFGGSTAQVTGITIRGPKSDHVAYELTWWANGSRNCAWVESVELKPASPALRIGFGN